MIKANKGIVQIKGGNSMVEAEFITIIKAMYEEFYKPKFSEEDARQEIYCCIRLALASEENLPTVMENVKREKVERIKKHIKKALDEFIHKEEGEEIES